jgi:hypothetical protein
LCLCIAQLIASLPESKDSAAGILKHGGGIESTDQNAASLLSAARKKHSSRLRRNRAPERTANSRNLDPYKKNGNSWVGLPGRPVIDGEGRHHVVDGKRQYAALLE